MTFRATHGLFLPVCILLSLSTVASAYHHWMFLTSSGAPPIAVPARFDLSLVRSNTVQYFIAGSGPAILTPGDTPTAVHSEVQQAAAVWNSVSSSALRVGFGGIVPVGAPIQAGPRIDVIFDDEIPPGILAQTTPSFPADLSFLTAEGTSFVPLMRSRIQLRNDLTAIGLEQPSYADQFFLTLIHEFGHAIGLQHTLTSSVMSTSVTRGVKRGTPLAADDIAGVSTLYPASGYLASTGWITGRVMLDQSPVNMASVVALSSTGAAVSTLTNVDGTYRIEGLRAGAYMVYAHPLPPAALGEPWPGAIAPTADRNGNIYPAHTAFDTQFYPGTRDWRQANQFKIFPGRPAEGIDFAMQPRADPGIYSMETYGYQDSIPVAVPPLAAESRHSVVFHASGTTVNQESEIAPGLNVDVVGKGASIEAGSLGYYTQGFLLMTVATEQADVSRPVTLAVSRGDDLYVLPSAFWVEPAAPPAVFAVASAATDAGAQLAIVNGANLTAGTRFLFDGAPGKTIAIGEDNSILIAPPPAPSAHQAVVEAVNPDGQTSLQALDAANRPLYLYPVQDDRSLSAEPAILPAGTDGMVRISGVNTHFTPGQTRVGFGSSDLSPERIWVTDATHMLVNVKVDTPASAGPLAVTVSTGLEMITGATGLEIAPAAEPFISLRTPAINAATGLAGVPAGGTALIRTTGLPSDRTGWILRIGGVDTAFTADDQGVISAHVPDGLTPGPQVVELFGTAGLAAPGIVMQLDSPPPVILAAFNNSAADGVGLPVSWFAPVLAGDTVTLTVEGLAESLAADPSGLSLALGNSAVGAIFTPADGNLVTVQFVMPIVPFNPDFPSQAFLRIGAETRLSDFFALDIQVDPPPSPSHSESPSSSN